jgi:hypothetical protein
MKQLSHKENFMQPIVHTLMALFVLLSSAYSYAAGNDDKFGEAWRQIVKQTREGKAIRVAGSVKNDSSCGDANFILDAFPQAAAALSSKRYGDYLKILGTYQRRLLCLDVESIDAVDKLLAIYLAGAKATLPTSEAVNVRLAMFNFGLLTFDQQTSTWDSFWLRSVAAREKEYARALSGYPVTDLGIWALNPHSGALERLGLKDAARKILDALMRSEDLNSRACYTIDLREKSTLDKTALKRSVGASGLDTSVLTCGQRGGSQSKGESGNGAFRGGTLGGPPAMACLVAAAKRSGMRGQLECVNKTFGLDKSLPTDPTALFKTNMGGVLDKMCAQSQDAGDGKKGDRKTPIDMQAEKKWYDRVWDWVKDVFAAIPPGMDYFASEEAPVMAGTGLELKQNTWAKDHESKIRPEDQADFRDEWNKMNAKERQEYIKKSGGAGGSSQRPVDGHGGNGPCSDPTGASARMQQAYECVTGEKLGPGDIPIGPTPRRRESGERIGLSVDPDNPEGLPKGVDDGGKLREDMQCLAQGGNQLRLAPNDPSCTTARCADPDNCTCDGKASNLGNPASVIQAQKLKCRSFAYCTGDGPCPCDGPTNSGGPASVTPDVVLTTPTDPRTLPLPTPSGAIPGSRNPVPAGNPR